MNEIVFPLNKISLARHKWMPQMHLRQPGFTYNASRPFTKKKKEKRKQKLKETGDSSYICQT